MKKILLSIFAILVLFAIISSCSNSESDSNLNDINIAKSNVAGENWTVFVYLCGTDLETNYGVATDNLQEMLDVNQTSNIKVVVQTGGTEKWQNDIVDANKLERYEISEAGMSLIEQKPLKSMGEADTLGDFLQWGVQQYPADKYVSVIWNHGGGSVSGVAFDQLYDMDSLDLSELALGISQAGVQFEIIGFDTCLMATLENASVLCPYGRYMVASEEIEPGSGWDFAAWLQYICDNPQADGLEVGKVICDSYYAKCQAGEVDEIATLSVTDLSLVPKLASVFDQMASELEEIVAIPEKYQPFAKAMSKAENYGGNNDNEGYTNMVDLGDLVRQSGSALMGTGTEVLAVLEDVVKYKVNGSGRQKSSGLSLFVPLGVDDETLNKYAETAAVSGNYLRYFESIYDWKIPQGLEITSPVISEENILTKTVNTLEFLPVQQLDPDKFLVSFQTNIDENGSYILEIDTGAEVIQSVAYNLYYEDDSGETLMFLGSDYDLNYDEESGLYWDNFRSVWPIINDQTCSMIPVDWNEEYINYTVPIKLNGQETNLRMVYDCNTNLYSVIGTWDGITESGMSSKEIRKLKTGDTIVFLFGASDFASGDAYVVEFGGFTVSGDIMVEEAILFDAVFYYEYEITDIFGRVYTSDLAKIVSENGEITIEPLNGN
ncbi:MAG: hypothetical protein CVU87_12435 [Firmicutes bacterium HGW-Firmicutes-12]|nr:MAG: hypothetical protein CVU87_12435 [Firmicutes bacterium HGW-Firmicutes-12]